MGGWVPTFGTKGDKIRDYCAPAAVILLYVPAFRISRSVREQKSISQAGASVTVLNAAQSPGPSSLHAKKVGDLFLFMPHFCQDELGNLFKSD